MAISAWILVSCLLLFFSPASATDSTNNPADQLVAVINSNRTAHKSSVLFDNPGLGCIALQYIQAYQGQCDEVGGNKKPSDSSFADTFAPNCGVEAQTLAPITGRLLACQSSYVSPDQAFSDILIKNARSLQILYDKNHTQVGAAVRGTDGGAPYFWCVLFSGGKTNSTFVLEGGVAKTVRPGCFSGNNDDCSGSARLGVGLWQMVVGVLIAIACAVGL
ncbi:uncharacterized protein [Elaeis guineensis]|uniref:Uncharacterized protein LOC105041839 isoform X1 n=1 Tax=Elaeis guineensis var. tenera TaxID=51953 RepID=A0A6I9QY08_ELAGV|nr:uncharacterized protein LOC105041839 isoform X1 [Elaeis guineensis]